MMLLQLEEVHFFKDPKDLKEKLYLLLTSDDESRGRCGDKLAYDPPTVLVGYFSKGSITTRWMNREKCVCVGGVVFVRLGRCKNNTESNTI